MRQSSSFFIFKYSSEVIGCASDSFFLFPELIVITKSSLLFYDEERVTVCCYIKKKRRTIYDQNM